MTELDPRAARNWQGFADVLRPPSGYRLGAAVGTTFGLTFEAMIGALLAMSRADGEGAAQDPAAATLALTQLKDRVRFLVHPGTIGNAPKNMPRRLATLMDRIVAEVRLDHGLFHPKIWALRFVPNRPSDPELGRVLVSSRNLSDSTSFELGAAFEGTAEQQRGGSRGEGFAADVAAALRSWLDASSGEMAGSVKTLPAFVRQLRFDESSLSKTPRLRRQGRVDTRSVGPRLASRLPSKCRRMLVLTPFLGADFIKDVLNRTEALLLVTTVEALDGLTDAEFEPLAQHQRERKMPTLYCVNGYERTEENEGAVSGLHAKLVIAETEHDSITFVGSANGTGPGWGLGPVANVETMLELSPGIELNSFWKSFVVETKERVQPWIRAYDRASCRPPSETDKAERRVLRALHRCGNLQLKVRYRERTEMLMIEVPNRNVIADLEKDVDLRIVPFNLQDRPSKGLGDLADQPAQYDKVRLADVSAFVVIHGRDRAEGFEATRIVLGDLEVDRAVLERRDEAAREELLAGVDAGAILNALLNGLSRFSSSSRSKQGAGGGGNGSGWSVGGSYLETLLQAAAQNTDIITNLKVLLGKGASPEFSRFMDDLERASVAVRREFNP